MGCISNLQTSAQMDHFDVQNYALTRYMIKEIDAILSTSKMIQSTILFLLLFTQKLKVFLKYH